jgi:SLT domain-containing protein
MLPAFGLLCIPFLLIDMDLLKAKASKYKAESKTLFECLLNILVTFIQKRNNSVMMSFWVINSNSGYFNQGLIGIIGKLFQRNAYVSRE